MYTACKCACIWSFSGPYFPSFGLNMDQKNSKYGHFSHSCNLNFWILFASFAYCMWSKRVSMFLLYRLKTEVNSLFEVILDPRTAPWKIIMMANCFYGMINQWKVFGPISSWNSQTRKTLTYHEQNLICTKLESSV